MLASGASYVRLWVTFLLSQWRALADCEPKGMGIEEMLAAGSDCWLEVNVA